MALQGKTGSGFSVLEFVFIFTTLFIIIILFIFRYDKAISSTQVAQAKLNLKKICDLQKAFKQANGFYGELGQIQFDYPGPSHSFEYFISLGDDRSYFLATAKEKDGYDPLKNNQPGDQIMTIDPNGYLGM